jgi:hypothetical protein
LPFHGIPHPVPGKFLIELSSNVSAEAYQTFAILDKMQKCAILLSRRGKKLIRPHSTQFILKNGITSVKTLRLFS